MRAKVTLEERQVAVNLDGGPIAAAVSPIGPEVGVEWRQDEMTVRVDGAPVTPDAEDDGAGSVVFYDYDGAVVKQ